MDESSTNRVWQYSLSLTTIAPIEEVRPQKRVSSLQQAMVIGKLQQGANIFAKGAKGAIVTNPSKSVDEIFLRGRQWLGDTINSISPIRIS